MCCGHLAPTPLHSLPDATRSLLGATRARPCCSLLPWRTSDAQTTNCVLSASSLWLAHHCLGIPRPQRHRHLLAAPNLAAASTHFLALMLLALPSFARATLRLARRCRSFSSFSSSRTRSCVTHGRKAPPVAGSPLSRRPNPQRHRHCLAALTLAAASTNFLTSCCSRSRSSPEQPDGWQGAAAPSLRSCALSASSLWLAHRCLGVPSPQRHRHLLAAPNLAAASTHFLALLLLALPSFARATMRLARRCRSFSSFSSSRTRSCVTHGRKGPL